MCCAFQLIFGLLHLICHHRRNRSCKKEAKQHTNQTFATVVLVQDKLEKQAQRDREHPPKALNRRFIVIEGIYQNFGDIAPLRKILELRDKCA